MQKTIRAAKTHCQLVRVHGNGVMNVENVSGIIYLMGGRTDVL
jgi:hypothetical protein